jgi:hypothetical protein
MNRCLDAVSLRFVAITPGKLANFDDPVTGLQSSLRCRASRVNFKNVDPALACFVKCNPDLNRRVQRHHFFLGVTNTGRWRLEAFFLRINCAPALRADLGLRLLLLSNGVLLLLVLFRPIQHLLNVECCGRGSRCSPVLNALLLLQAKVNGSPLLPIGVGFGRNSTDDLNVAGSFLEEEGVAVFDQLVEHVAAITCFRANDPETPEFLNRLFNAGCAVAFGWQVRPENVYTRTVACRRLVGFEQQVDDLASVHRLNYVFYWDMVDLKLKRVSIRNWMKFQKIELDLPEKGLVLVQGVNTASGGALLSVGSGKTGIGEAISRTLLGVPGRFTHLKQFSTDKRGNTYVKVEAELLGKALVVESGYKCKELSLSGEALRYHYDGKTVERGKIDQTRDELSKLLGVTPLLATWTAFVDGDSIKFNKLGQADSVELVMTSLRQPPWSSYHESSKTVLGRFRRAMAVTENNHQSAATAVQNAKSAVDAAVKQVETEQQRYDAAVRSNEEQIQRYQRAVNSKKQKIEEAKGEMAEIAKKLKRMEEERAVASHQLEIKLHEIEDKLRAAEQARAPLTKTMTTAQRLVTEANVAHRNYANAAKNCPTCNRPMGKIDPERLQQLAEELEAAKQESQKASDAWTKAEQKVVTLNEQYREISKQHREVSAKQDVENLADRHEELEIGVSSANEEIHEWELEMARFQQGPSDANLRTAKARLVDHQKAHTAADKALQEAADALVADQATLKVLEYWNLAFSPYGIPNMVLRDAIAPLNKEARRVSAAMTGGTIEVRYSTTRELASGLEKAQLNIEVDNKLGDKDLTGSSKGEAGLTNFIIAETLSEVGQVSRRVGYRWYDEIVPHQDPKVCHSIYAYMKDVAQRLGILVFLVDHNPVAANYADHVLIVEKTGESGGPGQGNVVVSRVRWR